MALHMARGMPEAAARRAALLQFGNVTLTSEDSREQHRVRWLEDVAADLRYAWRTLSRSPAFTFVAVLTVALGIGANTAIFGVIDAVLLKSLPVRQPDQLVFVSAVSQQGGRFGGPPYPWFEEIRSRSRSFDGMAVFAVDHLPITIDGPVEQALVQVTSGSYHDVLGVNAVIGRTLRPDDERLSPPVAVLSHHYWQHRFDGRRDVIGSLVRYNERSFTIVGVTAPGFNGLQTGQPVDITLPVTIVGNELLRNTETWWCETIARVKQGIARETAQAEAGAILTTLDTSAKSASGDAPQRRVILEPAGRGGERLRRQLTTPLVLLLGVVVAVLVIGCANIANLLSVRAAARRRELAVRRAIGAGKGRLARQLLTESLVLFTLGAAAGLLTALALQRVLSGFLAVGRNPIVLSLSLDMRVLTFTGVLTLLTGLAAGVTPAWREGRRSNFTDLRLAGGKTSTWPISRALVVVQVALSIIVLVGGSLFLRTLTNLRSIETGFRAEGVLTVSVQPLEAAYSAERRPALFNEVLRRVHAIPGVQSASLSVLTPLSGRSRGRRLAAQGFAALQSATDRDVNLNYVSPQYFETLGIPVRLGRLFAAGDDERAPRVALMSAEGARFYSASGAAVGQVIAFEGGPNPRPQYSLVGVVGDSKHRNMRDPAPRFVYLPIAQVSDSPSRLTLAIRTTLPLTRMADAVQRQIQQVSADILVSDVETLPDQVDRALLQERIVSSLSLGFAILGVLLAALGLYGVTSYAVLRRSDEIGVRMALGSTPGAVRWLILRDSLGVATIGVAAGVPLSLAAAKAVERMLYGVSPMDTTVIVTCTVLLLAVTGLAGYLPARRASRIDPVRALNSQ